MEDILLTGQLLVSHFSDDVDADDDRPVGSQVDSPRQGLRFHHQQVHFQVHRRQSVESQCHLRQIIYSIKIYIFLNSDNTIYICIKNNRTRKHARSQAVDPANPGEGERVAAEAAQQTAQPTQAKAPSQKAGRTEAGPVRKPTKATDPAAAAATAAAPSATASTTAATAATTTPTTVTAGDRHRQQGDGGDCHQQNTKKQAATPSPQRQTTTTTISLALTETGEGGGQLTKH